MKKNCLPLLLLSLPLVIGISNSNVKSCLAGEDRPSDVVTNMIENLDENSSRKDFYDAINAYNNLSNEEKSLISETNVEAIEIAQTNLSKDAGSAEKVKNQIASLNESSSYADYLDAVSSFKSLSESSKELVTNYEHLFEMKDFFDLAKSQAQVVMNEINKLPPSTDLSIKAERKFDSVMKDFNNLSNTAKAFVKEDVLNILNELETVFYNVKVQRLISKISSLESITTIEAYHWNLIDDIENEISNIENLNIDDVSNYDLYESFKESYESYFTLALALSKDTKQYQDPNFITDVTATEEVDETYGFNIHYVTNKLSNFGLTYPIQTSSLSLDGYDEIVFYVKNNGAPCKFFLCEEQWWAKAYDFATGEILSDGNQGMDSSYVLPTTKKGEFIKLTLPTSIFKTMNYYFFFGQNSDFDVHITNFFGVNSETKNVLEMQELVNKLPSLSEVKISDKKLIINVRNSFDKLTDSQKAKIVFPSGVTFDKLLEKIHELEILNISNIIDELPSISNIDAKDKGKIDYINSLLNEMNPDEIASIKNLDKLTTFEQEFEKIYSIIYDSVEKGFDNTKTFTWNYSKEETYFDDEFGLVKEYNVNGAKTTHASFYLKDINADISKYEFIVFYVYNGSSTPKKIGYVGEGEYSYEAKFSGYGTINAVTCPANSWCKVQIPTKAMVDNITGEKYTSIQSFYIFVHSILSDDTESIFRFSNIYGEKLQEGKKLVSLSTSNTIDRKTWSGSEATVSNTDTKYGTGIKVDMTSVSGAIELEVSNVIPESALPFKYVVTYFYAPVSERVYFSQKNWRNYVMNCGVAPDDASNGETANKISPCEIGWNQVIIPAEYFYNNSTNSGKMFIEIYTNKVSTGWIFTDLLGYTDINKIPAID